jgi:ABC-type uncharacterized transport system involved in gliding motility auxiliary subunit
VSKAGKFLFSFAVLFFLGLLGFRYVYGGWQNSMWVPLGLSVALFIAGVFKDWRAIRDFFAMRTTKHGLNVGALIIIALVGLACVNFLAVRYEKKFDWTSEKLNSLSDQSIKAARGLKADTEFTLLYRNDQSQGESVQRAVQDLLSMYQNVAPKLKYSAYNALQHPELAKKFEYTTGSYAFFVAQGETHVRIDQPTEEGVTRALLKLGHEKK